MSPTETSTEHPPNHGVEPSNAEPVQVQPALRSNAVVFGLIGLGLGLAVGLVIDFERE